MRTVSFVEHLELNFNGNLAPRAVCLGDADNDGLNELIIGNVDGLLAVFKGSGQQPLATSDGLGMIACTAVADVRNSRKQEIICLSADGLLVLFELQNVPDSSGRTVRHLVMNHKQRMRANTKLLLVDEINSSHQNHLVIGYSDRMVASYVWCPQQATFLLQRRWHLTGQVGSLTVHNRPDGGAELLASQPGRQSVVLLDSSDPDPETPGDLQLTDGPMPKYARNPTITTEIVGNVLSTEDQTHYFALASLDGSVVLLDEERILWSIELPHQLFGLTKLDVTGDGMQEVLVCAWDGFTYIVNHKKHVTRFQIQESVAAFCAGHYSMDGRTNTACLVYGTFRDRVCVYYSLQLPRLGALSLKQQLAADRQLERDLHAVSRRTEVADQKELFHWLLYGCHDLDKREPSPEC